MRERRITYANVASTLALVLVLSGVAVAAATLPRNSVGTRQLKRNAVKTKKVANGSLLRKDFKKGQVDAPNVKRWGPVRMNVGDPMKTLVTFNGVGIKGECTWIVNGPSPADDQISMHFEGVAIAEHLSYRSYEEDGAQNDYDEDLNPGEGANWGTTAPSEFVGKIVTPPTTFTTSVVYPNGRGMLSRHVAVANHGNSDCLFLGRFDKI